jgi:predicted phosphodiesterase
LIVRLVLGVLILWTFNQVLAPADYEMPDGSVLTYDLEWVNHWGQPELSLGPFGRVRFEVNRVPIPLDLKIEPVLESENPFISATKLLSDHGKTVVGPASGYIFWKIPWLILLGVLVGFELTRDCPRLHRKLLKHVFFSEIVVIVIMALVGPSVYLARNDDLRMVATGPAEYLSVILPAMMGASPEEQKLFDLLKTGRGIEVADGQMRAWLGQRAEHTVRILCMSDRHGSRNGAILAKKLIEDEALGITMVLDAGDTTNFGTVGETRALTQLISGKETTVLAIGGNHDDRPAMDALSKAGYQWLDSRLVTVQDISIYGVDDPSAKSFIITPSDEDEVLAKASEDLLADWKALIVKPDVLLVHSHRQAQGVIDYAIKTGQRLVVVYGHDHKASVKEDGSVTSVDVGSSGASGFKHIADDPKSPYTFQILEIADGSDPHLVSVTTVFYKGVGQDEVIEYKPINQGE